MAMKCVLIVSHEKDQHAQLVKRRLKEMGAKTILWNLGAFPNTGEMFINISAIRAANFVAEVRQGGFKFEPEDVKGVWWRRPYGAQRDVTANLLDDYIRVEAEVFSQSIVALFSGAKWVSTPEATRLACRKPVQLIAAKEVGLTIPETCVGNSWRAAKAFLDNLGSRKAIMKPVGSAFVRLNRSWADHTGKNKAIYTRVVSRQMLEQNKELVANCPFILQEAIEKPFDVRVTVVGRRAFAAEIRSDAKESDPNFLDWRNSRAERLYAPHTLPNGVAKKCVELTQRLGLQFGCIDFGFSPSRGYVFFEINPQGQWLPSESKTRQPISEALASLLTGTERS